MNFGNIFKSEADLAALNEGFIPYYAAVAKTSIPAEGKAGGWMVQAMYLSMGTRHDYPGALKSVKAPVLVIHGANDLQPEKASRNYADSFSNSRFVVIENAAHFSFNDQPEKFSAVTGEFLSGLK